MEVQSQQELQLCWTRNKDCKPKRNFFLLPSAHSETGGDTFYTWNCIAYRCLWNSFLWRQMSRWKKKVRKMCSDLPTKWKVEGADKSRHFWHKRGPGYHIADTNGRMFTWTCFFVKLEWVMNDPLLQNEVRFQVVRTTFGTLCLLRYQTRMTNNP